MWMVSIRKDFGDEGNLGVWKLGNPKWEVIFAFLYLFLCLPIISIFPFNSIVILYVESLWMGIDTLVI